MKTNYEDEPKYFKTNLSQLDRFSRDLAELSRPAGEILMDEPDGEDAL